MFWHVVEVAVRRPARRPTVANSAVRSLSECATRCILQDVNHRIGNNLAMVSGMLGVQIAATADEKVRALLRAAQGRVATIANAPRRLRVGSDLSTVRADGMIESVMSDLSATVGDERRIKIETELEPVLVESRDAASSRTTASTSRMTELCRKAWGSGLGARGSGLGSKLVVRIAAQFGGVPRMERGQRGGTRVVVALPELKVRPAR